MYFTKGPASKAEEEGGVWTQGWYGVVLRRAFMEELLRAVRWAFEDPSRAMEVGALCPVHGWLMSLFYCTQVQYGWALQPKGATETPHCDRKSLTSESVTATHNRSQQHTNLEPAAVFAGMDVFSDQ